MKRGKPQAENSKITRERKREAWITDPGNSRVDS